MTGRQRASLAVAALASAVPAGAVVAGDSYADHVPVVLDTTVRDTETGARAKVRYFNQVMTGGREIFVDADGVEHELHWDGWKGVFEVDFAIAPGTVPAAPEGFVRGAVAAVCPSVDAAALDKARVQAMTPTFFRVDVQCPAADEEAHP